MKRQVPTGKTSGTYDGDALEYLSEEEESLQECLLRQLHLAEDNIQRRFIGQQLIDLVDETGYITADLNELAARLGVSEERIFSVLKVLQTFDPVGVAARNLKECLAIQLKEKNRFDPAMETMLDNLELVAKRISSPYAIYVVLMRKTSQK